MNCEGSFKDPIGYMRSDIIGKLSYGICRVCGFKKRLYYDAGTRYEWKLTAHRPTMDKWQRELQGDANEL